MIDESERLGLDSEASVPGVLLDHFPEVLEVVVLHRVLHELDSLLLVGRSRGVG